MGIMVMLLLSVYACRRLNSRRPISDPGSDYARTDSVTIGFDVKERSYRRKSQFDHNRPTSTKTKDWALAITRR